MSFAFAAALAWGLDLSEESQHDAFCSSSSSFPPAVRLLGHVNKGVLSWVRQGRLGDFKRTANTMIVWLGLLVDTRSVNMYSPGLGCHNH